MPDWVLGIIVGGVFVAGMFSSPEFRRVHGQMLKALEANRKKILSGLYKRRRS